MAGGVGSPKRIQDHGSTQAPSSFERDEVATDFSDGERDAIDSVVSVATYALDTRKPAALASCPDQFADAVPLGGEGILGVSGRRPGGLGWA